MATVNFVCVCLLFWRLTDDSAVMAMRNYLHQQFTQFEKDFRELIPFAFNSSNLKSQLLCSTGVQWGDVPTLWVAALCFGASIIVLKMTAGEPNELIHPGAGRTVVIYFDSVGEHHFAAVSHSAVVSFQMDELDSIHGYSFFYTVPVETVTMDMVKQDFKRRWGFAEMWKNLPQQEKDSHSRSMLVLHQQSNGMVELSVAAEKSKRQFSLLTDLCSQLSGADVVEAVVRQLNEDRCKQNTLVREQVAAIGGFSVSCKDIKKVRWCLSSVFEGDAAKMAHAVAQITVRNSLQNRVAAEAFLSQQLGDKQLGAAEASFQSSRRGRVLPLCQSVGHHKLSSCVPASDAVEVSSPAHALGSLQTSKLLFQWFWL